MFTYADWGLAWEMNPVFDCSMSYTKFFVLRTISYKTDEVQYAICI